MCIRDSARAVSGAPVPPRAVARAVSGGPVPPRAVARAVSGAAPGCPGRACPAPCASGTPFLEKKNEISLKFTGFASKTAEINWNA
eukprot:11222684-Lingulodinium_polyedra.AAC.1